MKFLYLFTVSVIASTNSRKYDVEEEAKKLYGEDLNAVLLRFRKSTDYMHILKDKTEEIWEQLDLVNIQIKEYFTKLLQLKVCNDLGYDNVSHLFDTMRSRLSHLRWGQKKKTRRDDEESPITILDYYPYLHKDLPTPTINKYKDMGFSIAGQAIDTIINHLGSDDVSLSSTRLPYGDDDSAKTITDVTHDHKVTAAPDPDITIPENPEISIDKTLRQSYKKVKH